MRIRRCAMIVLAAAVLLPSAPALADDFDREGYYVSLSGAYALELLNPAPLGAQLAVPPLSLEAGNAWGLNVRGGRRANSWLAFEVEYEWMDDIRVDQANGIPVASYAPDTVAVNARFYLPFWRVQPYALVGGGLVSYDLVFFGPRQPLSVSDQGFAFRGGGGVDVYLTRNLVFNAEATVLLNTEDFELLAQPAIEDLYYVSFSAGLALRF